MTFTDLSERYATDFLQTVILVDDNASFAPRRAVQEDHFGEQRDLAISIEDAYSQSPPSETVVDPAPEGGNLTELPAPIDGGERVHINAHGLDAKASIEAFAAKGLICAVLKPTGDPMDILGPTESAAARADVLIVDWILRKNPEATAQDLILRILQDDLKLGRTRLIIVYSGEPDLDTMVARIRDAVRDKLAVDLVDDGDRLGFTCDQFRVVAYGKPRGIHQFRKASEADLADVSISEFTKFNNGLVSNVALQALGGVRLRTHHILRRLNRGLDAAYLSHRAYVTPEDADALLIKMAASEIADVVTSYTESSASGASAIEVWFDDLIANTNPEAGLAATFKWPQNKVKENLLALWTYGSKINPLPQGIKGKAKEFTSRFLRDDEEGRRKDSEFAYMLSVKDPDHPQTPTLKMGQVVFDRHSHYYVCAQPVCDSVRVGSEGRDYFFLHLSPSHEEDYHVVIKVRDSFLYFNLPARSFEILQFKFAPESGQDVISARRCENWFAFKATDGRMFRWVGELRPLFAQRIAERQARLLSRIGLEESEAARTAGNWRF